MSNSSSASRENILYKTKSGLKTYWNIAKELIQESAKLLLV